MALETQDKTAHVQDHDSAWISVQAPMHVDLDEIPVPNPTLRAYVETKLNAIAPWLAHSTAYQSAFDEACQLCQNGYDFNLIVYEQPAGHYIPYYEPTVSTSATHGHRRTRKVSGLRRYWQRLFKWGRQRTPRPKYRGEIVMAAGKCKWVEVDAGRFIIVPEGILRYDQAKLAV